MELSLNPALDVNSLAKTYALRQRIQVRDVLDQPTAAAIAQCLESDRFPWGFVYYDDKAVFQRAEEMARLTAEQRNHILNTIGQRARTGYQYAYNCYPMLDAYLQGWKQVPLLDRVLEFINSGPMIDFVRALTGRSDIIKADAQATRFGPGQFLKFHTDKLDSEYRVAAYVLNFTHDWDPDWGGYLQFYDEKWDIEQALLPRFNALNIFTVPQPHAVSYVAQYATRQRYAITGWFRYK